MHKETLKVVPLTGLHCNGRLIALPAKIRVEVNGSGKHSNLLRNGNNFYCERFYSSGKFIRTLELRSLMDIIKFKINLKK